MDFPDPEQIGCKIDSLGLWDAALQYNWAVKPLGTALPYFCTVMKDAGPLVRYRLMLLEGWQTVHDYVRLRVDRNYGFYSTPMELPHFELVTLASGGVKIFRNDPGYVPRDLVDREKPMVSRILWEVYGLMMRLESDNMLPVKYSDERAMFARVESAPGTWNDAPLAIPDAQPYVERISIRKDDISRAKDLPFASEEAIEADFRIMPVMVTREARPRCAYALSAIDCATGERFVWDRTSVRPDFGLKGMWESLAPRLLSHLIARGRIPGEIKLVSGRMFRMVRPICMELPIKVSLHDSLPRLEESFRV